MACPLRRSPRARGPTASDQAIGKVHRRPIPRRPRRIPRRSPRRRSRPTRRSGGAHRGRRKGSVLRVHPRQKGRALRRGRPGPALRHRGAGRMESPRPVRRGRAVPPRRPLRETPLSRPEGRASPARASRRARAAETARGRRPLDPAPLLPGATKRDYRIPSSPLVSPPRFEPVARMGCLERLPGNRLRPETTGPGHC